MRNKCNIITEDNLPNVIKKKIDRYKSEVRLTNKKDLKLGDWVIITANENVGNRKIKITLDVLNHTCLEKRPIIPRYGQVISEFLQPTVIDTKGGELAKNVDISYKIKATEIDRYCYPLLFCSNEWKIAENYSIESDGVLLSDRHWSIVVLIKEQPNEIITIQPSGAIIYTELDKVTSLRIPKGNFKHDKMCKIQFVDMSPERFVDFEMVYEDQLATFRQMSQIFVIQLIDEHRDLLNVEYALRRPLSIKIPLPDWVISTLQYNNFDTKQVITDQKKEKLGFYFLHKIGDTWTVFDGSLNFTQNSLGFDTKHFGSFIFVNCRENREIRLCPYMSIVENLQSTERGVILAFLWIKSRNWFLWIEAVTVNRISSVRECLESSGLIFIEQSFSFPVDTESQKGRRSSRRLSKKDTVQRRTIDLYEDIQFKMSISGEIERIEDPSSQGRNHISDLSNHIDTRSDEANNFEDITHIGKRKVVVIDPKDEIQAIVNPDLSYHRHNQYTNATIIPIKPVDRPESRWTTIILNNINRRSQYQSSGSTRKEAITVPISDTVQTDIDMRLVVPDPQDIFNASKLTDHEKEYNFQCEVKLEVLNCQKDRPVISPQLFTFYIPVDAMKDYFNVLTKEELYELEMERAKLENEQAMNENQKEYDAHLLDEPMKPKSVDYNRIEILSNPRVRNPHITKDPKVISIKSMLALSSVIRQGLTLAVYLSLPENVIAGIGFDALSQISMNGMNNTTYKVLVMWKKMIHLNKVSEPVYVEQLMDALKIIGYGNIALLVDDHWKNNKDISTDDCHRCLLKKDN